MEARAVLPSQSWRWARVVRLGVAAQLAGVVAIVFVLRTLGAIGTQVAGYFPDEYIYSTLGRSLGQSGDLIIRGSHVSFPALLEPLLAAPFWRFASAGTAYELIQIENALFVALAAIPAYLLARKLRLSQRYALLCAVFAAAIPDGLLARYVLTDPLAYPLVLASLYAGLVCLESPTRRTQLVFLLLAALTTAARLQYAALFVAFAIAAVALERRRAVGRYRIVAAVLATCAAVTLLLGLHRVLGYYSAATQLHDPAGAATWFAADLFLLCLASGVALVPGAVGALLRPEGRTEARFAVLVAAFAAIVLVEAAVFASNGTDRFQERYLFTLLPLVPIAYGLHHRRVNRSRLTPLLVAVALLVTLSRVPMSHYATAIGTTDSPFLAVAWELQGWLGSGTMSLLIAAVCSLAAILGAIPRRRVYGGARVAVAFALVLPVSVEATLFHAHNARTTRAASLPADPSWIDDQRLGDVVAIRTLGAPRGPLFEQMFWNPSVTRQLLLGGASPTDPFASSPVTVARDGSLRVGKDVVRSPILFEGYEVGATFDGAVLAAHVTTFDLWKPTATPRLRLLVTGRYSDGWLAGKGRIEVWPDASGYARGTVTFTVSLPRDARPVRIAIGDRHLRIVPGERLPLRFAVDRRGPQVLRFRAEHSSFLSDFRQVSVRSTMPVFHRLAGRRTGLKLPQPSADS